MGFFGSVSNKLRVCLGSSRVKGRGIIHYVNIRIVFRHRASPNATTHDQAIIGTKNISAVFVTP